jgi:hypothetical protein
VEQHTGRDNGEQRETAGTYGNEATVGEEESEFEAEYAGDVAVWGVLATAIWKASKPQILTKGLPCTGAVFWSAHRPYTSHDVLTHKTKVVHIFRWQVFDML